MGNKVQYKSYISIHNVLINKNGEFSDYLYEANGCCYSLRDKELLKRTILEHEATFTKQVSELHRLYRIQKELMDELRNRDKLKIASTFQTSLFGSHISSKEASEKLHQIPHLPTGIAIQLPFKCFHISMKTSGHSNLDDKALNSQRRKFDLRLPAEMYVDINDDEMARYSVVENSMICSRGSNADGDINDGSKMVMADLNEPLNPACYEDGGEPLLSSQVSDPLKLSEIRSPVSGSYGGLNEGKELSDLSRFVNKNSKSCNEFTSSNLYDYEDNNRRNHDSINSCGNTQRVDVDSKNRVKAEFSDERVMNQLPGEQKIHCNAATEIEPMIDLKVKLDSNEDDRITEAADCLVVMSMNIGNQFRDLALHWFAEFVASIEASIENENELDMFEKETLNLKEIEQEELTYLNYDGEPSLTLPPPTGSRRGPARKIRQRRDFQKDILPGLISLSGHEVCEDLHSFGAIMRASCKSWKTRNQRGRGRGRRRRPRNLDIGISSGTELQSIRLGQKECWEG